ncbi:MAG TPA: hypothetical protein DCZ75_15530 [Geobacter sp.]|nr:hypothetical protein [Geobacter sp.]
MASGNPASSAPRAPTTPGLSYAVQFLLAATLVAGICARWSVVVSDLALKVTLADTRALGRLLGLTLGGSGDILSVNGFAMRIIFECTALQYVLILALAMLLYTGHGIGYRLFGVVVACVAILAANALRLIVTGMIGSVSEAGFHFVHEYLWVALFALLVFGIWKVWADGRFRVGRKAWLRSGQVLACSGLVFMLLFACKDFHYRALAALATPLFQLLLADPEAQVTWNGMLQFSQGGMKVKIGNYFELANLAVYLGLVLPRMGEGGKMRCAALVGLLLLVVTYAEFIAILGTNCLRHAERAALYQGTGTGVLLALPMAVYWMVLRLSEEKGGGRA